MVIANTALNDLNLASQFNINESEANDLNFFFKQIVVLEKVE